LGHCAAARVACVTDAMCGAGDRCVDPLRLGARVRSITPRDETITIYPHLAVDGDGYGVVWAAVTDEASDVWFARLDAEGKRRGAAVQLTRGGSFRLRPRLARGPSGWAVGWLDVSDDGVASHVLRLDAGGRPQGAPVRVGGGDLAVLSDVVASGSQYGAGYFSASAAQQISVHLARFGQEGAVGTPVTVASNQLVLGHLGLTAANGAFALGWNHFVPRDETAATLVARVAADGAVATPVRLDGHAGRNGGVALDAVGGAVGAVWEDNFEETDDSFRNGLAFGGLTAEGRPLPRKAVTARTAIHLEPNLAAAGAQHGLVFTRLDDETPTVQFGRLDAAGALVGGLTQLNGRASLAALGAVAFNGRGYAVAWTQLDTDGVTLRFARLDANGRRVGAEVPISPR
ncbi:MAG: hypothetical protein JWM10_5067, partial [Myxococcaceae bacterium]|nr:hypothetical protein [Myxococcaceae bacterium]